MRLLLSSALLGLFWFGAANILLSIVAWSAARAMAGRGLQNSGTLLTVRLMPAAASTIFVLGIFLPAHWQYEPDVSDESFGVVIGGIATLGFGLLVRAFWRASRILLLDRRLVSLALDRATPLDERTYVVGGLPGVSLAGILRPRILIGSAAVEALTPAELDVAISHEIAHERSRDNLKRFLMYCAPDAFGWTSAARRLEASWEAEAECRADAEAARGDERRAVVLASALVKVARLTRQALTGPSPAWSAFHVPVLLETRVKRLVGGRVPHPVDFSTLWYSLGTLAVAVPAGVWMMNYSYSLHLVTEALVTYLP